jgi:hypothetical protein
MTTEEKQFTEQEVMDLIKKAREMEQWRIAGDTGYGLAINHLNSMAQQVMQSLRQAFRQANAIGQAPQPAPEKQPEEE